MKNEISRKILVDAVKLIKQWHDFPLPAENAPEEMFKIYYEIAPEMKSIREVLGPYDQLNNDSVSQIEPLPAPNTVMWWLCRIADPEIRRKAVGYCFKYHITILSQVFDINTAVQCGFGWINTQEGNGYWYNLSKSEIPLLPEPDFTEYNELRK